MAGESTVKALNVVYKRIYANIEVLPRVVDYARVRKLEDGVEMRIRAWGNTISPGYNAVFSVDEPKEPEFNEWGEVCP